MVKNLKKIANVGVVLRYAGCNNFDGIYRRIDLVEAEKLPSSLSVRGTRRSFSR